MTIMMMMMMMTMMTLKEMIRMVMMMVKILTVMKLLPHCNLIASVYKSISNAVGLLGLSWSLGLSEVYK